MPKVVVLEVVESRLFQGKFKEEEEDKIGESFRDWLPVMSHPPNPQFLNYPKKKKKKKSKSTVLLTLISSNPKTTKKIIHTTATS